MSAYAVALFLHVTSAAGYFVALGLGSALPVRRHATAPEPEGRPPAG